MTQPALASVSDASTDPDRERPTDSLPPAAPTVDLPMAEPAGAPRQALTMFELAKLEEARRQAAQVDLRVRESASVVRAKRLSTRLMAGGALLVMLSAAIALSGPLRVAIRGAQPYQRIIEEGAEVLADVPAIPGEGGAVALGRSGSVKMRVAMPAQLIEFPLAGRSDQAALRYQWVRAADSSVAEESRPLQGNDVVTPGRPGCSTSA